MRMQSSKLEPNAMAARVLPPLVFGAEPSLRRARRRLRAPRRRSARSRRRRSPTTGASWFKPNNAKLVVVGDTTLAELKPLLEQRLASWKSGEVPAKKIGPAQRRRQARRVPARPPAGDAVGDQGRDRRAADRATPRRSPSTR